MRHLPPFFEYKNQFTYSKIERFDNAEEVQHPLVREALKYIPTDRIQIAYDADLPACSGIGSSSAFAVGLLQSLHALKNEFPDTMTLAKEAIYLERDMCKEAGGVQDQIAAAFGGFNRITFDSNGYQVNPVDISDETKKQLQDNLLLAFTGFTHFSGEIAIAQNDIWGLAGIIGARFYPINGLDLVLLYRDYSSSFNNPFANIAAFSKAICKWIVK